jgi:vacuolar-type H+-ATPase subunit F/Vma7
MKEKMRDIRILAITEEGYDAGFSLAGCVTRKVEDEKELFEVLERVMENRSFGIILVEEVLFRKIDPRKRKKFEESSDPVVIPISLRSDEKLSPEEYIRELTRRSIGYTLRIK